MIGTIFDIKEMAVHDGPGIRTTVFLKGCPLRCAWCHNPEGLSVKKQLMYRHTRCKGCGLCRIQCTHSECAEFGRCINACPENCLEVVGKTISHLQLAEELKKTAVVLGDSFGGFTFSGGEPFAQPEFLLALLEELNDYHLCIETSGYTDPDMFYRLTQKLNYVIMDIKLADSKLHKQYTGVDNQVILHNFNQLKSSNIPYLIRTPLIPGITDTTENLERIKQIIGDSPWQKLAYNDAAGAKYEMLGMLFPMNR